MPGSGPVYSCLFGLVRRISLDNPPAVMASALENIGLLLLLWPFVGASAVVRCDTSCYSNDCVGSYLLGPKAMRCSLVAAYNLISLLVLNKNIKTEPSIGISMMSTIG